MTDSFDAETELEKLYNNAPCGYHSLDSEGFVIRINDTELKMLGYSREELLGRKFSDLISPESLPTFQNNFPRFKERGWVNDLEFQFIRKDGTILPVSLSATVVKDAAGNYLMSHSVVIDISDRQQLEAERQVAEANLRASEERYRLMFESNPNPMWFFDPDTLAFLEVNQAAIAHYGYSRQEFLQMTLGDIIPPEDISALHETNLKILPGQSHTGAWRHCKQDGSIIDVKVTAYALGLADRQANLVLIEDITELKRVEDERQQTEIDLQSAQQRIISIWESMTDAYTTLDHEWRIVYANPASMDIICQLTNLSPAEVLGTNHWEVFPWSEEQRRPVEQEYQRAIREQVAVHLEFFYEPTGNWFEIHAYPSETGLGIYFRDISDRKQAHSILVEQEQRYHYIFESAGISIWEEDYSEVKQAIDQLKASGVEDFRQYLMEHPEFVQEAIGLVHLRDVNQKSVEMFGAKNKAELLTSLHQIFTPKSQPVFLESIVAIANGETNFVAEAEAQTLQGVPLNILLAITFPPNSESYDRVVVSLLDISERKQIEQVRERFLAVGSDLQIITGENGYFHWVSPTFEPALGWTREELTSQPWAEFIHPDDVNSTLAEAASLLSGRETLAFEHRFRHKDGSYRWLLWKAQPYVEKQLIYAAAVDITERKQAELILEQQIRREKAIADISQHIHRSLDLKQVLSSTAERIGELLQSDRVLIFRFEPDWSGKVVAEYLAAGCDSILNLDVNDPCFGKQYVEPYRQGRVYAIDDFTTVKILSCYRRLITQLQVRANLIVPILQGEHLWGLLIAHQCFTPRQWQTEEIELLQQLATQLGIAIQQAELYQRNAEQAALIDIASAAIFVRDLSNKILFWSQGAERLYGWKKEEIQGQEVQHLFHAESLTQLEFALKTTINQGNWNGELQQITQDGREIIVESRWTLMRDPKNHPQSILVVNSDITEKKQLEKQLLHAQRIESIGTLAGGIAHDLNNILTPILGFTQLLPKKIPNLDESNLRILGLVRDSALRGAEIVKQILLFSRVTEIEWESIYLSQIIEEVIKLIQGTFPKSIVIEEYIAPNLWSIQGDSTQLHQVLMNLCVNARDAMPDGGKLIISAENISLDEQYTYKNLDLEVGNYILLTIIDTGVGIPQNIIDQIFDPFFTTKETGKGTGLGLATVIGIVKNHGGAIAVESEPNNGTQFRVYLPQAESTASTQTTTNNIIPLGQKELILVVDDEATIREVTKANLENYNYRVITAKDGIEAIALYAQQPQEIQAVLMDLTMPEMDGLTAMRTLKKINPTVKLIVTSGLATTDKMIAAELIGIKTFLVKPYTAEKLLLNLAEVIATN